MGNESGKLKDLEMDKTPVESTPYWSLYNALASSTANEDGKQYVSVFQSKSPPADSNWTPQDTQPLFRATKVNLNSISQPHQFISERERDGGSFPEDTISK